ncbi:MAG: SigE family RNA polymerase sigma factor [Actinomycetota bacterium]
MSAGRRQELGFLFREQYAAMVRLAHLLTSDRGLAEDIAQEAFVRTWRAWNRIRNEGSAPAYLRSTVVNLARSSLRRRLVEHRHDTAAPEGWDDPDAADRMAVLQALGRLPRRQRSVVVLRYHLDLSEQETAEALGIAQGTVKSQAHKALARLGELLADDIDE